MGHRAHYVLVRNGSWELYYAHWGALDLALDLVTGPVSMTRFIEEQVRRDNWMYDSWCEGTALVDHDKRVLLFNAPMYDQDFAQRACLFHVLPLTWPGWQVRWAHGGLSDVRVYVGVPAQEAEEISTEHVASTSDELALDEPLGPPEDIYGEALVITVEDDHQVSAYAVWDYAFYPGFRHLLGLGPGLTGRLSQRIKKQHLPVVPEGGLHIDTVRRRIAGWTLPFWHPSTKEITARWPGWTWTSWEDRFWEQARAARGTLTFPESDLRHGYGWLQAAVDPLLRNDPAAYLRARVNELHAEGNEVSHTGPGALSHTVPGPDPAEHARLSTVLTELAAERP